jgi:hypothetical protein
MHFEHLYYVEGNQKNENNTIHKTDRDHHNASICLDADVGKVIGDVNCV